MSVKNFLSIGSEVIEVTFQEGLSIITGINKDKEERSNGTGKSSTMEALYFGITGKTLRGLNKADIVNKKTKKGTLIEVKFSKDKDEYHIIRGIKPSILTLTRNGKDISRDSIANTQTTIDKVISVTEDVIKNSVIMGINQTIPFMAQSKVEKRKFIEGIFDMTMFSEMLKLCRGDYNELAKELTATMSKLKEKTANFDIYKEQESKFDESKRIRLDDIQTQLSDESETHSNLEKAYTLVVEDFTEEKEELGHKKVEADDKLGKISFKKYSVIEEIDELKADIDAIPSKIEEAKKATKCSKCGRDYDDHNEDHLQGIINELRDSKAEHYRKIEIKDDMIIKLNNGYLVVKKIVTECEDRLRIIKCDEDDTRLLMHRIKTSSDKLVDLNNQYKKVLDETNELSQVVDKVSTEIIETTETKEKIEVDVLILDQIKFILGENGVKSYIINKMLDIFNNKINFYLEKLNANCVMLFDEFFEEKIINDKNQECSYFNFSSGERRNVDIAIMFAFMDIQKLQGKFDCNIMVFDELIDGSLDEEGVGFVLDILLDKCKVDKRCIYLITHRKEATKFATGEIIQIEKQNGISKRIKIINK
jgi:DNA repair exonuclease SbcCD ATPase subunit